MNSYRQSLYVSLIRIAANVLMLGAVFLAMYQASHTLGASELVFCVWFFGMAVPLWAGAFWLTKQVRRRYPAEFQSLVHLPRQGECLVCWRVGEASLLPVAAKR